MTFENVCSQGAVEEEFLRINTVLHHAEEERANQRLNESNMMDACLATPRTPGMLHVSTPCKDAPKSEGRWQVYNVFSKICIQLHKYMYTHIHACTNTYSCAYNAQKHIKIHIVSSGLAALLWCCVCVCECCTAGAACNAHIHMNNHIESSVFTALLRRCVCM